MAAARPMAYVVAAVVGVVAVADIVTARAGSGPADRGVTTAPRAASQVGVLRLGNAAETPVIPTIGEIVTTPRSTGG